MERLTDDNFKLGFDDSNKLPSYESIYERLRYYEILAEQRKMMILPCKPGDTVYELCKCDDGIYRIYPMIVKSLVPYGQIKNDKNGNICVWNVYAESDYTYMYKSFYDFGKTVFLNEPEAQEALEGLKMKQYECKKCGSKDLFFRKSGNNTGLYCGDCGQRLKWEEQYEND